MDRSIRDQFLLMVGDQPERYPGMGKTDGLQKCVNMRKLCVPALLELFSCRRIKKKILYQDTGPFRRTEVARLKNLPSFNNNLCPPDNPWCPEPCCQGNFRNCGDAGKCFSPESERIGHGGDLLS